MSEASARKWDEAIQEELDSWYRKMKTFPSREPTDILLLLSGWTARASEIRGMLWRINTTRASQIRIREIEPFLQECDRQFKIHSRIVSTREIEVKMQY